jgi:hypothetical protein
MLEAILDASAALFWLAHVVLEVRFGSIFASWQQMTRLLSMAGLICMPVVHACGEAKTLSNFAAVIPNAPAAAVLRKSRRF